MKLRSKFLVMASVLAAASIAVALQGAVGAAAAGDATSGKTLFASSGCGGCHTLADAGASGKSASNFDTTKPGSDAIVSALTNPPSGMPKGSLTDQQIQDVAAYIVDAAGKQAGGGSGSSRIVNVTLKKKRWKITLSPKEVSAGLVTFEIKNRSKRWRQIAIKRVSNTATKSGARSSAAAWSGAAAQASAVRFTRCRVGKSGLTRNICKVKAGHTRNIYVTLQAGKYKVINTKPACLWRCVRGRYQYAKGRSATLTVTEAAVTAGLSAEAQAFVDAGCGGCHTLADARTTSTAASSLDIGKPSSATVADVVTNGIKHTFQSTSVTAEQAMPAYNASMSAEQIQSMASYVSRITGGGDGSGQPAGRQNVLRTGCGSCHTLADVGGTGSEPVDPSYSNLDIAKPSFETVKTAVEAGYRHMPKFKAASLNSPVLTDQELADVETYISNVTGGDDGSGQPIGRQTFLVKGCGSCHTLADAGDVGVRASSIDIAKPANATVVRILEHNYGTSSTAAIPRWGLTPGMPCYHSAPSPNGCTASSAISATDRANIATYLSTITGGTGQDPAGGRQLSLVGGCGNCHVIANTNGMAKGTPVGGNLDTLKPSSLITDLVMTSGLGAQPPTDFTQGMPMYLNGAPGTYGLGSDEKLSAAEIDAVAAFVRDATGGAY